MGEMNESDSKPMRCPYPDCNPDDCVRIEFANDSVTVVCGWCEARGPACPDAESATDKWNAVARLRASHGNGGTNVCRECIGKLGKLRDRLRAK